MDLVDVRCPKCHVTVGVMPGSVAWHCGQKMEPVAPAPPPERFVRARHRKGWESASDGLGSVYKISGEGENRDAF